VRTGTQSVDDFPPLDCVILVEVGHNQHSCKPSPRSASRLPPRHRMVASSCLRTRIECRNAAQSINPTQVLVIGTGRCHTALMMMNEALQSWMRFSYMSCMHPPAVGSLGAGDDEASPSCNVSKRTCNFCKSWFHLVCGMKCTCHVSISMIFPFGTPGNGPLYHRWEVPHGAT
jgi:hypothetical protein